MFRAKASQARKKVMGRRLEAACRLLTDFLLDILFDLEYGGSTFLRNVGILVRNYTAFYHRNEKPIPKKFRFIILKITGLNLRYFSPSVFTGCLQISKSFKKKCIIIPVEWSRFIVCGYG